MSATNSPSMGKCPRCMEEGRPSLTRVEAGPPLGHIAIAIVECGTCGWADMAPWDIQEPSQPVAWRRFTEGRAY